MDFLLCLVKYSEAKDEPPERIPKTEEAAEDPHVDTVSEGPYDLTLWTKS